MSIIVIVYLFIDVIQVEDVFCDKCEVERNISDVHYYAKKTKTRERRNGGGDEGQPFIGTILALGGINHDLANSVNFVPQGYCPHSIAYSNIHSCINGSRAICVEVSNPRVICFAFPGHRGNCIGWSKRNGKVSFKSS